MAEQSRIKYRDGYKYQLLEDYTVEINIRGQNIDHPFIKLDPSGLLTIKTGYAWDGASGPARDTKNFMRGSLVHDALYQLMREEHLDHKFREEADLTLKSIIREDGMNWFSAWAVFIAVDLFAGNKIREKHEPKWAP